MYFKTAYADVNKEIIYFNLKIPLNLKIYLEFNLFKT